MSTDFKFDPAATPGRKQRIFSQDDDYYCYRQHMFEFATQICDYLKNNKSLRVLEIGPSSGLYVEKTFPQFDTAIIKRVCDQNSIYYKTLDVNKSANTDYTGSVDDLSFVTEKFDVVILMSILEPVPNVFSVPEQLYNVTNDNAVLFVNTPFMFKVHGPIPDCWRFSEYGYKALFKDLFSIQDINTFPPNETGKNSIPLSLNVVLKKT